MIDKRQIWPVVPEASGPVEDISGAPTPIAWHARAQMDMETNVTAPTR